MARVRRKSSKRWIIWNRGKIPSLHDMIDVCEYANQLTEEELDWLGEFCDYFYKGNPKAYDKLGQDKPLTPEQKKACYKRNNARNADIFSRRGSSLERKLDDDVHCTIDEHEFDFDDSNNESEEE